MANLLTGEIATIPERKTHCLHGHELTPENTCTRPRDGRTGCVTCQKANCRRGRTTSRPKWCRWTICLWLAPPALLAHAIEHADAGYLWPDSLQDADDDADAEGGDWFYFLHRVLLETLQRVTLQA